MKVKTLTTYIFLAVILSGCISTFPGREGRFSVTEWMRGDSAVKIWQADNGTWCAVGFGTKDFEATMPDGTVIKAGSSKPKTSLSEAAKWLISTVAPVGAAAAGREIPQPIEGAASVGLHPAGALSER